MICQSFQNPSNRLLLVSGISACWTVSHASSFLFHPAGTPDLPLLNTAAPHNMAFTCRCKTRHSLYLLKCIQVDSQIACCRDDTDKQTHFSETAGPVRPERALFTIGTPRDCLGICPVDSSGAPLWTPSLEWRSLWIQSSMEVVRGISSFCQCLSPSVALFTVVVTIWQLPLSIMCTCTKFPFLQQSGEGFSSSNPPLLALWEGWGIAEFE